MKYHTYIMINASHKEICVVLSFEE